MLADFLVVRGFQREIARSSTFAAVGSTALLLLAMLVGAGAYALTRDASATPFAAISGRLRRDVGPRDLTSRVAAPRPPLLTLQLPPVALGAPGRVQPPASDPRELRDEARPLNVVATPVPAPAATPPPDLHPGQRLEVPVSFYYCEHTPGTSQGDGGGFCGRMRDGAVVYPGAAACDVAYLGQAFRIIGDPAGRIYRCADTGSAVAGLHRDIWFQSSEQGWRWQLSLGLTAVLEILP